MERNLSYNRSPLDVKGIKEAGNLPEYFEKVVPQVGLGAVFITINCIIVFTMWRKQEMA